MSVFIIKEAGRGVEGGSMIMKKKTQFKKRKEKKQIQYFPVFSCEQITKKKH